MPGLTPGRGPGQAPESSNFRNPLDSGLRRSDMDLTSNQYGTKML